MAATAAAGGRPPWHFWVVGVFALLFNTIGVIDFVMVRVAGASYLAASGMTPPQVAHYIAMPLWAVAVWAIGVFAAFVASVLLLLRRASTVETYALSIAAYASNLLYSYALTDGGAIMGPAMAITSGIIAGLLVLFACHGLAMRRRGVLA